MSAPGEVARLRAEVDRLTEIVLQLADVMSKSGDTMSATAAYAKGVLIERSYLESAPEAGADRRET